MIFAPNIFAGKIIVVTGGGSGIGKSIAAQYLSCGATVIITGRKADKLEKAKVELEALGKCNAMVCDIRELPQIDALIEYVKETYGRCDILVNNAGGQFISFAEELSINGWNSVIHNNLNGTWYMTQKFGKAFFIPQEGGVILNMIVNIFRGVPGMIHTGAARAGIDNFTKSLAVEWAKYNIKVNAVAPGIIDSTGLEQYPEELKKDLTKNIPAKRLGTTDEVAQLCLFMTSPAADYMTGETIYLDGGWHLSGDMYQF